MDFRLWPDIVDTMLSMEQDTHTRMFVCLVYQSVDIDDVEFTVSITRSSMISRYHRYIYHNIIDRSDRRYSSMANHEKSLH